MNHLQGHPFLQDDVYVRMIQAGGVPAESAIQDLYLKYRLPVIRHFKKLLRKFPQGRILPEDLLHDAFLVMLRKIEEESLEVKSLCAYWKGVGQKLLSNQLRKDERILLVSEPEEEYSSMECSPEKVFLEQESVELLAHSFRRLGRRCRDILILWVGNYGMDEIAEKLNLSGVTMARKIKYECFKKLKEWVKAGNKLPS
ncbi:MAG TPA: sigma-70 family RNA polymerase sigma factor [Saprospiraceae bacterium]|nr:sigma-70 family RNA polymerase sigma factor [Saprospiraceae bacterium]